MPVLSRVRARSEQHIHISSVESPAAVQEERSRNPVAQKLLLLSLGVLGIAFAAETVLLLVALVPQSQWATLGYPNGPIPRALYPGVAFAFYLLPTLTGLLCRRWQAALVLATAPAWIDLGAFAVAAASKIGPFWLAQQDHAISAVGTLELFAALGALGWLARTCVLALLGRGEWGRQ